MLSLLTKLGQKNLAHWMLRRALRCLKRREIVLPDQHLCPRNHCIDLERTRDEKGRTPLKGGGVRPREKGVSIPLPLCPALGVKAVWRPFHSRHDDVGRQKTGQSPLEDVGWI